MAAMRAALRRATPALAATAALVKLQTLDRKDFAPSRCSDSLEFAARELLRETVQFAELNGLLYGLKDPGADASAATQCPVAMLPFKIPSRAFQECVALSPLWNKLVDAVARDVAWLHATLEPAASADPFTGRLLQMSKEIHREGLKQPIMLGIHRSDYMLHEGSENSEPRFLQVELNTIASSMGAHALNVGKLHRFLLSRFGGDGDRVAQALQSHFGLAPSSGWSQRDVQRHLPENVTLQAIPAALAKAHQAYGVKDAKVVFVVNEDLRNFADWCQLEYALWQTHGVRVVQRTLAQLKQQATMEQDGTLRLDGSEVSVVYYRAGYGPEDYPTEVQWDARGMLERSKAIKCPSVDYQLVGAKKVQQALARPGAVERFLSSRDSSKFHSAKALHNICGDSAVRWKQQAAKAGAIEALVAAMVAHREDVKVQGWAAGALYSLCSAEDAAGTKLKHQVFKAGGLEVLLAALQLEDVRCRTWSACAGLRICCGEDSAAKKQRQHAMEVGFTTSLASSISALATALHSDDVELRGCGAWALWKLWEVMEDEMPQRAVEAGVLEALVYALNSRDVELQRPCVNVLYSTCVGEDAAALERKQRAAQAGSLEALVDAMKHSKDADLQRDAACALGNLCSGDDQLAQQRMLRAAEASAVLALQEALTFCEGDEELSEAIKELIRRMEEVLRKARMEEDGASTVAFLEAAIPAERQHVQLEVDDEPAVPEEPAAAVPFAITTSLALPSVETQPHYTPSIPSSQLREGLGGLSGLSISGPVPVMTPNNCFEPQYVPMPAFAEDVSELPV